MKCKCNKENDFVYIVNNWSINIDTDQAKCKKCKELIDLNAKFMEIVHLIYKYQLNV